MISHDVIVVGAGVTGMRAGIEAFREGADTAIVTKTYPPRCHSVEFQGGTAAPISRVEEDSWEEHMFDTVKGADYLADQDAVEILTRNAAEAIFEMENWGVLFSRKEDGRLNQRAFGGHSNIRACFASDKTGHTTVHTLFEQILKSGLKVYNEWHVTRLISEDGICKGIVVYDMQNGEFHTMRAKSVVFCTGGYGRVYGITTNDLRNNGDGMSMSLRAGVPLEDMEFVQFHPTGLHGLGTLMTEGARGEGGYLLNDDGDRFTEKYAPKKMELGPRDILARGMQKEIDEGRGISGEGYVYLDVRHLGADKIKERLSGIRDLATDALGVDPIEEPIPVQPTAHYSMGGISVDTDCASPLEGFFAAGESACVSLHGANRLGTNSSLDCHIFGKRAGRAASERAKEVPLPDVSDEHLREEKKKMENLMSGDGGESTANLKGELQSVMMSDVWIFRNGSDLKDALDSIKKIRERFEELSLDDQGMKFNTDYTEALELENLIDVAWVITKSALAREESRGSHYRTDFEVRDDDNWLKHTMAYLDDGEIKLDYGDVTITRFEPKERKY